MVLTQNCFDIFFHWLGLGPTGWGMVWYTIWPPFRPRRKQQDQSVRSVQVPGRVWCAKAECRLTSRDRPNFDLFFVFGCRTGRFDRFGPFSFSAETSIGCFVSVSFSAETKIKDSKIQAQSETARHLHLPPSTFISGIQYSFIWIQLPNC